MKTVKKQDLPKKICMVCHKPFSWRKKWEKNWDEVKYCSERCRKKAGFLRACLHWRLQTG